MNSRSEKDMTNFDWVTERSLCSSVKVFETLKLQVTKDIETRNKLRPENSSYEFHFVTNGDSFTVAKEGNNLHETVTFKLVGKAIQVLDKNGKKLIEATLTLNDDGECRLKINGRELESWQMRGLVLEDLFFGLY